MRRIIVSFHDLHPASQPVCARFLDGLHALGVARASLLTVPCWHGSAPCSQDASFVAWLRARSAEGHEICLHGLLHEAEVRRGHLRARLISRYYTAGEGEFYQIAADEAASKLQDGLRILAGDVGVPIWGFTAPAWLLSPAAWAAVRAAGFHYSTAWGCVHRLQCGDAVRAPTLVWSSRRAWRRTASRLWVRCWGAIQRRSAVLRIAVHPEDLVHPAVERSLWTAIRRHRLGRRPVCYRDLLPAGTAPLAPLP